MVWLVRSLLALRLLGGSAVPAQEQEAPPNGEANYEFVSGTIVDLPPGKISVDRSVLGKASETRTFLITSETKVEGRLRTRARVTVGFKPSDDGDVAVRIIVRGGAPNGPPKKP